MVGINQPAVAQIVGNAMGFEQLTNPVHKIADDFVFAGGHGVPVVANRPGRGDTEGLGLFEFSVLYGRGDQRFGGDASTVQTDPAELVDLDNGNPGAFDGGPNPGCVAAGSTADYDNIIRVDLTNSLFTMSVTMASQGRFQRSSWQEANLRRLLKK